MTRRAARIDANQPSIVSDLRDMPGVTVRSLAGVGEGVPDLIVGYEGFNWLFEVKDPSKPPSERKLTDAQHEFFTTWRGQVRQILTADDAFKAMGILR